MVSKPSSINIGGSHASEQCMQNVVKIYYVGQELKTFLITANGRTDSHHE